MFEDSNAWAQASCHEDDLEFLNELDIDEDEFDRRLLLISDFEAPARPEADGYGMLSGEYESSSVDEHQNKHKPIFKPVYSRNISLPTLAANHTLQVHAVQFRSFLPHGYVTKLFVNGQWVVAPDVPARNGAIHVIKRLIKPQWKGKPRPHHVHLQDEGQSWVTEGSDVDHEWDDWEEWLLDWANED